MKFGFVAVFSVGDEVSTSKNITVSRKSKLGNFTLFLLQSIYLSATIVKRLTVLFERRLYMFDKNKSELLHSLFILKGLLGTEFSKDAKDALNIPEYILMKMVSDGNTNLAQIREYLAVSKPAVSQMLSALEKRGLLTKEPDPESRRNLIVKLTPAGQAVLAGKELEFDARYEKIRHNLTDAEITQFVALISKMNTAIERARETADS